MSKIVSGLLFGLMLVLPLDFLFFIGLKKHYFDFYKIDVYFNVYFFDNQPFLWIALSSLVLGYLILYTPIRRVFQIVYIVILLLCFSMLFEPVAGEIGSELFMKRNLACKLGSHNFKADLLYSGRENYFLKRPNKKTAIKIPKNKLKITQD